MPKKAKIIEFPKFTQVLNGHVYKCESIEAGLPGHLKIISPYAIFICEKAVGVFDVKDISGAFKLVDDITNQAYVTFGIESKETLQIIQYVRT
jgi:hypothetical protein